MSKNINKSEFCKLCGISPSELSVYIGRGKVISKGKNVDLSLPENAEFVRKRKDKIQNIEVIIENPIAEEDKEAIIERSKAIDRLRKLNTDKKQVEIDKIIEESELVRLKRKKMQGFLIPTELVKMILLQNNKSITIAFQQAGEELILEISKKKSRS